MSLGTMVKCYLLSALALQMKEQKKNIYSMYTFNLLFNGAVAKFSWLTGHNHCKWTFNRHDKYVKNISFSTYILVFSYIESKIKHSSRSLKWYLPSLHRSIDRSAKVVYGLKVTKNFFSKTLKNIGPSASFTI